MRRRTFCLGLGALAVVPLLAACEASSSAETPPTFRQAETLRNLAALDSAGIERALTALQAQGEDIARGLTIYSGRHAPDASGVDSIYYLLAPGAHRLTYVLPGDVNSAVTRYRQEVAGLQADPRGQVVPVPALPYPAALLTYDDTGASVVMVGSVVVLVIASGTNPRLVTDLTLGGVAHLERMVDALGRQSRPSRAV